MGPLGKITRPRENQQLKHSAFDVAFNSTILEIAIEQTIPKWQCHEVNNKSESSEESKGEKEQRDLKQSENSNSRPQDQGAAMVAVKLESVCRSSKGQQRSRSPHGPW